MRCNRYRAYARHAERKSCYPADVGESIERLDERPRRDWIWLIILIALSIGLGTLQNRARSQGSLDPVSKTVQTLLLSHVARVGYFSENSDLFWQGVKDARQLRAENESLKQQLSAVQAYLDTADGQEHQIQKLRGMLNLNTVGRARVNADIISYVPYDNRITLNRGSNDGVKPNLPIITAEGLLALVSTVTEKTCQASLLTSSGVSVGGVANLSTPVAGFVKGEKSDRLVMDVFDNVDIPAGTEIITTGYSEFIPRGIRIGIVSEYFNDQEYGIRRAFIIPSSRIGMSKEVVILK